MISDIIFALCIPAIVMNIFIILMVFTKGFLKKIFSTYQLCTLLKGFVIYATVSLPIGFIYIIYRFIYIKKANTAGVDIYALYYIKDRTISNSTEFGNHIVFILFFILWLLGILIFGIVRVFKENIFLKKLEKLSKLITDDTSVEIKNKLIKDMEIKNDVLLFINPIVPSPFIIGLSKPKVFLPEKKNSEAEVEFILRHEFTHLKSKDYIYRKLIFILCVLYWFNPIIYIFSEKFIELNEMACDEQVLINCEKKDKIEYMRLLCSMACDKIDVQHISSIIYFKGKTELNFERRIKNIMKKYKKLRTIPFALISAIVLSLCPVVSYAATNATIDFQSDVIYKLTEPIVVDDGYKPVFEEIEDNEDLNIANLGIVRLDSVIVPNSSNGIDVDVDKKKGIVTNMVSLSSHSTIGYYLKADSSSDKFKVGLINDKGEKIGFVSSKNGKVVYDYTVNKSGNYKIYILNTGSKRAHISGYLIIQD